MYPTFPFSYFGRGSDYVQSNDLDVTGSSVVCAQITGGNPLTLNPKTANSNLVAGDICLIAILGRINNNDTNQRTMDPPTGWSHLLGVSGQPGDASYEARASVWYLWKVYQDSDNTDLDFTPTDTDYYCYIVYAMKGLSKRCPFPSVYPIHMGPTLNQDYRHAGIYVPPMLQANPFGNVMLLWPNKIVKASLKNVEPYDFDPATSTAFLGGTPSHSLNFHQYYTNALENNTDMQSSGLWVLKGFGNDGHQNVIATTGSGATAGALNVGPTGSQGIASLFVTDFDRSSYYTSYAPQLLGDESTQERYIEWEFEATAGDKIVCMWRGWANRNSTYGGCGLFGLVDPAGNKMSGVTINNQNEVIQMNDASVNFSAEGFSATDDWGGFARQSGSAFVSPHPRIVWFQDTATSTGTHKVRLWFYFAPTTTLSWTIGATAQNTWVGTDYVGVGINGVPSEMRNTGTPATTPGTTNAFNKIMSTPFIMGGSSSAWDRLTDWPVNESGRQGMWAIGLGYPQSDFPVPMLVALPSAYGPMRPIASDTNWLSKDYDSNKSISAGFCDVGVNLNSQLVNRPIYPYYYATEDATSATIGKYYWEITLQNGTDNNSCAFGIMCGRKVEPNELRDAGGGCIYQGNGTIFELKLGNSYSTGNATLGTGDVLGIGVDYDNAVVRFWVNTVEQTSVPFSSIGLISQDFRAYAEETMDLPTGFTMNLTGPFNSKPAGFVAYDWTNEVA